MRHMSESWPKIVIFCGYLILTNYYIYIIIYILKICVSALTTLSTVSDCSQMGKQSEVCKRINNWQFILKLMLSFFFKCSHFHECCASVLFI